MWFQNRFRYAGIPVRTIPRDVSLSRPNRRNEGATLVTGYEVELACAALFDIVADSTVENEIAVAALWEGGEFEWGNGCYRVVSVCVIKWKRVRIHPRT